MAAMTQEHVNLSFNWSTGTTTVLRMSHSADTQLLIPLQNESSDRSAHMRSALTRHQQENQLPNEAHVPEAQLCSCHARCHESASDCVGMAPWGNLCFSDVTVLVYVPATPEQHADFNTCYVSHCESAPPDASTAVFYKYHSTPLAGSLTDSQPSFLRWRMDQILAQATHSIQTHSSQSNLNTSTITITTCTTTVWL